MKTMFFEAKNKALAKKINIQSPMAFKESIRKLKEGGLSLKEKRALVLAQNRAKAMLKRKVLSLKERIQMKKISNMGVR